MTAAFLVRGDARMLPLATGSVQCVVTSPPYFGLRSYGGQTSIWGGDPECPHSLVDGPALKPMTGGTGPTSGKQTSNKGSQFGNAWAEESALVIGGKRGDTKVRWQHTGHGEHGHERLAGAATCTRCGAWRGELGSEPNVAMFISHLVEVFRECKRVMRDDAVMFVNIGDGYSGSGKGPTGHNGIGNQEKRQGFKDQLSTGRAKSLQLVPERLAIALSDDGWVIRSRICWAKTSAMPESVRDRPSSAWEHIWMLTKGPRYYWDADSVREPHKDTSWATEKRKRNGKEEQGPKSAALDQAGYAFLRGNPRPDAGANMRNFWLLGPDPYSGAHFATFPKELPRRCILAATSEAGACAACGAAWKRVVERGELVKTNQDCGNTRPHAQGKDHQGVLTSSSGRTKNGIIPGHAYEKTTTGWAASCKCDPAAGVRPCVVLDPFSGSGTTAFVAASLGRVGVGVELSEAYTKQARYGRLAQGFLPLAAPPPSPAMTPLPLDVRTEEAG